VLAHHFRDFFKICFRNATGWIFCHDFFDSFLIPFFPVGVRAIIFLDLVEICIRAMLRALKVKKITPFTVLPFWIYFLGSYKSSFFKSIRPKIKLKNTIRQN